MEEEEEPQAMHKGLDRPTFHRSLYLEDLARDFLTPEWVRKKCKIEVSGARDIVKAEQINEENLAETLADIHPHKQQRTRADARIRWAKEHEEWMQALAKRQGIAREDVDAWLERYERRLAQLRRAQQKELESPTTEPLIGAQRSQLVARDAWQFAPRPLVPTGLPKPGVDPLRLFYVGSSYNFDPLLQGTLINVWGNLDDEHSTPVLLRLRGFQPHFYLRMPSGWSVQQVDILGGVLNQELYAQAERELKRMNSRLSKTYAELLDIFQRAGLQLGDYLQERYHFGAYGAERGRLRLTVEQAKLVRDYQFQQELATEMGALVRRPLDQQPFVQSWKLVRAKDLHFWKPKGDYETFVDFYLLHPKLVRMARDLLENPRGLKSRFAAGGGRGGSKQPATQSNDAWRSRPENWDIPAWFNPSEFGLEGLPLVRYEDPHGDEVEYRGFDVFEADVDFIIRHLVDKGDVAPCMWFRIDADRWHLAGSGPRLPSAVSRCALEAIASDVDFKLETDPSYDLKVPALVKAGFDIEVCVCHALVVCSLTHLIVPNEWKEISSERPRSRHCHCPQRQ